MSGLEAAIKNALAKSDRSSAEVRARIYHSSRQALEAGLKKQEISDPETVALHRQRLETLIRHIEQQERDRLLSTVEEHVKRTAPPVVEVTPERPLAAKEQENRSNTDLSFGAKQNAKPTDQRVEPSLDEHLPVASEARVRRDHVVPTVGVPDDGNLNYVSGAPNQAYDLTNSDVGSSSDDSLAFKPERVVKRRKRRGVIARISISLSVLAFMVLALEWVYTSGVLLTPAQRDSSVPNPPPQVVEEDFLEVQEPVSNLGVSGGFSEEWVEIFSAEKSLGTVRAGSQAIVEAVSLPSGRAVRLTSKSGGADGDVIIDVPASILTEMSGKASTISITLQSATDAATQVTIDCQFSSLGTCTRHRFTAMPERSDMLINTVFDGRFVSNTVGSININTDIDGTGRAINLYSVRILPGQ